MTIRFVTDRIVQGKAYPALTTHVAEPYTQEWKRFIDHSPRTVPAELLEYCNEHSVEYELYTIDAYPANSYYIVHLGWFDFAVDYIALLPLTVFDAVRAGKLRILFYYHEGDDPFKIKNRLDSLCAAYKLTYDAYRFVSGNTAAAAIENFVYFAGHELLYYTRNKNDKKILKTRGSLQRTFTCLSRTHQWWRATALADLHRRGLLDDSYWSYNPHITVGNTIEDCPIEIDTLNIREYLTLFMQNGPYSADDLAPEQHNDHTVTVAEHYRNAYCNIVFETLFDADGSGGAFLSEKTFKPIKHGQPFVVAGCAGTLQVLRDLGYRVFDSVIDTTYDTIQDNTRRWIALRGVIESIAHGDLDAFRKKRRADVEHNQALFLASKANRLNMLFRKIQND